MPSPLPSGRRRRQQQTPKPANPTRVRPQPGKGERLLSLLVARRFPGARSARCPDASHRCSGGGNRIRCSYLPCSWVTATWAPRVQAPRAVTQLHGGQLQRSLDPGGGSIQSGCWLWHFSGAMPASFCSVAAGGRRIIGVPDCSHHLTHMEHRSLRAPAPLGSSLSSRDEAARR